MTFYRNDLFLVANEAKNGVNRLQAEEVEDGKNKYIFILRHNEKFYSSQYLLCLGTNTHTHISWLLLLKLKTMEAEERVRAHSFFDIFKINFQRLVICFAAFPCYFCCHCQFTIFSMRNCIFFSILCSLCLSSTLWLLVFLFNVQTFSISICNFYFFRNCSFFSKCFNFKL